MSGSPSVAVEIDKEDSPDKELDTMDAEDRDDSVDVGGDCEVAGSPSLCGGDKICWGMARAVTLARGLLVTPTREDAEGVRAWCPNGPADEGAPFDFAAVTFGGCIRIDETTLFLVGIKLADDWEVTGSDCIASD
jgi:hypothetical protein